MNHRDTEIAERGTGRVLITLCALCLCGSSSFAAKPEWPQRYNTGVTAYRSNDFTAATTAFEQATASVDRALQQRAHYNLGNTEYRRGEADTTKAQPLWERAMQSYEAALALDPTDEDAKFNLEFVKKKLEELKKQQEQQQQNQKNEDQQKQEQPEEQQQQPQPEQHQQPQPKPDSSQAKEQPREQPAQQAKAGDLDKQQAKALLDNLREDERNWNFFPEVQMKDLKATSEPAKDW